MRSIGRVNLERWDDISAGKDDARGGTSRDSVTKRVSESVSTGWALSVRHTSQRDDFPG